VDDALHTYTVPLSWEIFQNMSKNDDIRILAKELTPSSSEEKENTQVEKKAKGKETSGKTPKKEQKGTQEKGQAAKTGGGKITPTPREKRLQSRVERTKKVQASEGTPKADSAKLKEKAPSAKHAKTVPSASTGTEKAISTGSLKMASTGSQKQATTGLYTGSSEKRQQKEKSAEILAREAAVVLATLGTSPKPKEK